MQNWKSAIKFFGIITATMLATQAVAQSGRGRPKVPQPAPTTAQPAPAIKVPATAAVVNKEQLGTTSRFVLRNGITVIISEHHSTPMAAAVARFKAGASDEPWSMSPVARLATRLILSGTVLRPGERAVDDLRALGALIDAGTSYDGAAFALVVPSDKLRASLGIQADMLQNSVLDAESVRKEIQLLTEEEKLLGPMLDVGARVPSPAFSARNFMTDERDRRLYQLYEPATYSMARMFNTAFTGAPSLPTNSLRSVTREQVMEFYRSHYRPDNLIISVAGDVSTFNTLVEIQQLFGDFGVSPPKPPGMKARSTEAVKRKAPAVPLRSTPNDDQMQPGKQAATGPDTPVKAWGSTEQGKLRYAADRGDISQSIVTVGFHVPGADSKDWPATEVLTALAGQGRASQLSRSLVDGQMLANRIESDYQAYTGAGLLTVQMWLAKGVGDASALDKAESAFFKELDRLRRETQTEGDIARAKAILEKRFIDESALYPGRSGVLARTEAAGMGLRAALDYRARIRAVTADEVQRLAAKYVTLANTTIHEYEPLTAAARTFDSDTFSSTVAAWAPGFGQLIEKTDVREADASSSLPPVAQGSERSSERQAMLESVQPLPIKDFSTLNGPKAFVREDHSRPAATVAILFQGGNLIEDVATSGTTELMLRSILYGTQRTTYSQVAQELEQLGAEVSVIVEPDFFGFVLSALSRNADRALKLLRDMIEEPAFRNDDVGRARLGQIAAIRDSRDSGLARSRELLLQALYDGHPYSLPPHGREEVVAALTGEKLTEWYARAIEKQLPLAIIVGDTDGSALVSSQLAEGFKRRDVDAAIQVRTPRSGAAGEKAESRRNEHSTIAVGTIGPRAGSADLLAVELFESMLNGEGGRLLRELRDKQGLVTTAALSSEAMFLAGVLVAYITTPPEREQRAKAALLAEFERLGRGGLSADELASARALAMTLRVARVQSQPQHALCYARAIFYKQPAADVDTIGEEMGKVSFEDIKRVGSAIFKTSSVSTAIVRGSRQSPSPPPPAKQN